MVECWSEIVTEHVWGSTQATPPLPPLPIPWHIKKYYKIWDVMSSCSWFLLHTKEDQWLHSWVQLFVYLAFSPYALKACILWSKVQCSSNDENIFRTASIDTHSSVSVLSVYLKSLSGQIRLYRSPKEFCGIGLVNLPWEKIPYWGAKPSSKRHCQ